MIVTPPYELLTASWLLKIGFQADLHAGGDL